MNGAKAKILRRKVYGEGAQRDRKYGMTNVRNYKMAVDEKRKESLIKRGFQIASEIVENFKKDWLVFSTGTLIADPQRRQYKDMKREYKRLPRTQRSILQPC